MLKFIYSEKVTKFREISTLLWSVCTVDKSKVEISQNSLAFSEYTNFSSLDITHMVHSPVALFLRKTYEHKVALTYMRPHLSRALVLGWTWSEQFTTIL